MCQSCTSNNLAYYLTIVAKETIQDLVEKNVFAKFEDGFDHQFASTYYLCTYNEVKKTTQMLF